MAVMSVFCKCVFCPYSPSMLSQVRQCSLRMTSATRFSLDIAVSLSDQKDCMACRGSGVRVFLAPSLKTLSMKVFKAAERPLFSAFLRIVSEPLHVEQVVNRPDRPPALQGLGPATPWWAELGPDQWSPWHWNGPWAFFRDFPYVKPMNHQVSHGLFFGCLYPRDGARGWTATIEGHGNTRSHPS